MKIITNCLQGCAETGVYAITGLYQYRTHSDKANAGAGTKTCLKNRVYSPA
ncbi:MAG: hypothetical protein ACKV2V_12320 [Blastocatellia bacterium]